MANFNRKALIYGDASDFHQQRQKDEFLFYAGSEGWSVTIDDEQNSYVFDYIDRAVDNGFDIIFFAVTLQNSLAKEWSYCWQNNVLPVLPHCDNSNSLCTDFNHITEWMAIGGDHPNFQRRSFGPHLELETYAGTSSGNPYNISTQESYTTSMAAGVLVHILENDSNIDLNSLSKKEAFLEARARLRTKGDNYNNWTSGDNDGYGYFDHQDVVNNYSDISDVRIQPPVGVFARNVDEKTVQINWTNYNVPKLDKTVIRDVKRNNIVYDGSGEFPRSDGSANGSSFVSLSSGFSIRNYHESNEFEIWHEDQNGNQSKRVSITETESGQSLNSKPADAFFLNRDGAFVGGNKDANPQVATNDPTILNFYPIAVDFDRIPSKSPLVGEVKVISNEGSGSENIFALFDTSDSPVFEFLGGGPRNNRAFVQSDDVIRIEIQVVSGTTLNTPITRDLKPQRFPSSNTSPTKNEVKKEISAGRLSRKVNRLEFEDEFNLEEFRFYNDIEKHVDIADIVSPVNYSYSGGYDAATAVAYQSDPATSLNDQELSYGRKIQNLKDWLTF